ncbi:MAG: sulfite exporter TauE/SafE family protein [Rhodoferax sp.]|nr:sulfite exporter TauE/SafE family protein [Rhodoferax sp.]
MKPYLNVGTDLLFAAFTKMSGTVKLARAKRVDWRVVLQLSAGSIPAALITLYILRTVGPASAQVQAVMTTTLGGAAAHCRGHAHKALRGTRSRAGCLGRRNTGHAPCHWSLPLLFGASSARWSP